MPDTKTQSYANHTKFDPPFHFFLIPILVINLVVTIMNYVRHQSLGAGWFVVLAVTALVFAFKMRVYSLRVQDRVIRLEERLRLSQLLNEPSRSRVGELTEGQLIALRFASDSEVPALVEATLSGDRKPKEIKQSIKNWRADHFRV